MSIPCRAIPNLIVYVLAQRAGGLFVSCYSDIMPVFGVVFAYIVFGDIPNSTLCWGVPVVFVGMAMVQRAQFKARGAAREVATTRSAQTG